MFTYIKKKKKKKEREKKKKKRKEEGIFDLSRFNASDSSYSTQKQTTMMAPFASHTEA